MTQEIRLDKSFYNVPGKSFTQVLAELDPDTGYTDTPLAGMDAFERQLKRFDIRVSGKHSDLVEKFFQNTESAALFPEYVSRAVKQGMEERSVLSEIVAASTLVNGMDYRSISTVAAGEEFAPAVVGEGTVIPTTEIKLNENLVSLKKRGRILSVSYEAIRFQRLDLFAVALRQIGAAIANAQVKDAVTFLVTGGGVQPAAEEIETEGAELTYGDLVRFWSAFDGMELTTLLASPATMAKILQFAELKEEHSEFLTTGKLKLPFGAALVKTSALADDTIIGLDKSCALEQVTAAEVSLEADRLIDRQMERAAITSITGFSKIFADAAKVLKIGG